MIERRTARITADRAAPAAAGAGWLEAAEPPVPVAAHVSLLNTRHVVPASEASPGRHDGGAWIV